MCRLLIFHFIFLALKTEMKNDPFVINDNRIQVPRSKHSKKEHSKFNSKGMPSLLLGNLFFLFSLIILLTNLLTDRLLY